MGISGVLINNVHGLRPLFHITLLSVTIVIGKNNHSVHKDQKSDIHSLALIIHSTGSSSHMP